MAFYKKNPAKQTHLFLFFLQGHAHSWDAWGILFPGHSLVFRTTNVGLNYNIIIFTGSQTYWIWCIVQRELCKYPNQPNLKDGRKVMRST